MYFVPAMHLKSMKAHQIQIPSPCSEDWDAMTDHTKGKYCQSCQTTVWDFSNLSDTQIQYILSNSEGKICGQMRASQMNRPMMPPSQRSAPDLLAVVLGITLLMTTTPAYSSNLGSLESPISLIEMVDSDSTKSDGDHDYIQMRFQFIDATTGESLPFIKAKVMGDGGTMFGGAMSDFDGFATFQLTPDQFDRADSLILQSLEFEDQTIQWNVNWAKDSVQVVELSSDTSMLRGNMELVSIGMMVRVPAETKRSKSKEIRQAKRAQRRIEREKN